MLRRDPFANLQPLIQSVYAYVAYRVGDGADAEDITATAPPSTPSAASRWPG